MFNQERQGGAVQFGVDIVHDDRKPFVSLLFNLCQGGESQRCCHALRLSRTEYISDAPTGRLQAQIMAVWTIAREPLLAVPRPRLIIALSVQIFHLFRPVRGAAPGL